MTACSIRAWPLRVAVHNPASRGEHACGRACELSRGRFSLCDLRGANSDQFRWRPAGVGVRSLPVAGLVLSTH